MRLAIIGDGAIGRFVREHAAQRGHEICALVLLPEEIRDNDSGIACVDSVAALPDDVDLFVDCAGHQALRQHGPEALRSGTDVLTVSVGALADAGLAAELEEAADDGDTRLHLVSGAIGALDCLAAANVGAIENVTYTGRKPPRGWRGSPAEEKLDLDNLESAAVHFDGTAREAATRYPKNANVAAAVAIAGVGFDATSVRLIADPGVSANIHEVRCSGDFGSFEFRIEGRALPDNPKSSALAAMSVISHLDARSRRITGGL